MSSKFKKEEIKSITSNSNKESDTIEVGIENPKETLNEVTTTETSNSETEKRKLTKQEKKELKKLKKLLPFDRWEKLTFIFSIIGLCIVISYFMLPVVAVYLGLFCMILDLYIIVFATVLSVGIVWAKDNWVKTLLLKIWNFSIACFEMPDQIKGGLIKSFPYVSISFGVIFIAFLVLSIVGFATKRKGYKAKMIVSICLSIVYLIVVISELVTFTKA